MSEDIRWRHRLDNYSKALRQLTKFIEKGELNEMEQQGRSGEGRYIQKRG